jgi:Ca-activated chloride channel family protein
MADLWAGWADFHFLRPWWLLGIIPTAVLTVTLQRRQNWFGPWSRAIDDALLPYLLDTRLHGKQKWPLILLLLAWITASIAAAGPVWEKLPRPVQKSTEALVIVQDLSLSLYAVDLKPNRLIRAHGKLTDILHQRQEGTTALVVYSGDAHVVAPLTEDTNTILAMITALSPEIMPVYGSNVREAVALALELLGEAGSGQGKILLLTDDVTEQDVTAVRVLLKDEDVRLSVIGLGTAEGGPVLLHNGEFLRDARGAIVVPRMNRFLLTEMAVENNGRYSDIQLTDDDFIHVLAADTGLTREQDIRRIERQCDQWNEQGFWLLFFVIPVALFSFRRGWLLCLVLLMVLVGGQDTYAAPDDLWQRRDQQAARAFAAGDFAIAAGLFHSPRWKGAAAYRAGNYEEAAKAFSTANTADDHYNRGNSLARLGQYDAAIMAYDQALLLDPRHEDARFNRDVVGKQEEQKRRDDGRQPHDRQQADDRPRTDFAGQGHGDGQPYEHQEQAESKNSGEQAVAPAVKDTDSNKKQGNGREDSSQAGQEDGKTSGSGTTTKKRGDLQEFSSSDEAPGQFADKQPQDLEQLLRLVPDNPGGLLRRKFAFESQQKERRGESDNKGKFW